LLVRAEQGVDDAATACRSSRPAAATRSRNASGAVAVGPRTPAQASDRGVVDQALQCPRVVGPHVAKYQEVLFGSRGLELFEEPNGGDPAGIAAVS